MRGGKKIIQLITPDEAIKLFCYARVQEISIARDLYKAYKKQATEESVLFLLAFIYDTGRVPGIREERARHATRRLRLPPQVGEKM